VNSTSLRDLIDTATTEIKYVLYYRAMVINSLTCVTGTLSERKCTRSRLCPYLAPRTSMRTQAILPSATICERWHQDSCLTSYVSEAFSAFVQVSLLTNLLTEALIPNTSKSDKFQWMNWLKTAERNQLRIINWPINIPPPDRKFNLKDLSAPELQAIVQPFQDNHDDPLSGAVEIKIVRWSESEC
jgi:hypothetical protein